MAEKSPGVADVWSRKKTKCDEEKKREKSDPAKHRIKVRKRIKAKRYKVRGKS
jgi:hypothetical protein